MQGISPFVIARYFIEKSSSACPVTPMKLMKLVYISHGWSLAIYAKPLISENIQAWKFGPVIKSLYRGFKEFGNCDIPKSELSILPTYPDKFSTMIPLLDKIWEKYGALNGVDLSALTHMPGTPWDTVWNQNGGKEVRDAIIPNTLIQQFYMNKLGNDSTGEGN